MGAVQAACVRTRNCCLAKKLEGPQTIKVTISKATNLKSLNVTGDAPYCKVRVVRKGSKEIATNLARHLVASATTKVIKGNLSPEWNEEFILTGWYDEDSIIFDVMDEGTLGAKREAQIVLDADKFYPIHFDSYLTIDQPTKSYLWVKVEYMGPTASNGAAASAPAS
mmetsp:Transcript_128867/g.223498  ORF Transcript_128867/g.223498 Transcript_128867/m.223498 type:complete len:167 (-) Transcript_128867:100-600(-)